MFFLFNSLRGAFSEQTLARQIFQNPSGSFSHPEDPALLY